MNKRKHLRLVEPGDREVEDGIKEGMKAGTLPQHVGAASLEAYRRAKLGEVVNPPDPPEAA